jgi:hypothetical protein
MNLYQETQMKGSGLRYNELVTKIVETFKPDQFANTRKGYKNFKTNIVGIDEIRSEAIIEFCLTEYIYQIESRGQRIFH